MVGGVTIGRVVTTADEAATKAQAQMDPGATDGQARRAAGRGLGFDVGDLIEVRAKGHDNSL
jgi:hypothetical protein